MVSAGQPKSTNICALNKEFEVVFQHDHHVAFRLTTRNNLKSRRKYEKIITDRNMHIFEKGIYRFCPDKGVTDED